MLIPINNTIKRLIILITLTIIVMVIVILFFYLDLEDWGNIGSIVGGLSTLVAVLLTFYIFKRQQGLAYKMKIETTFSEMLGTLREYANNVDSELCISKEKILKHFIIPSHLSSLSTQEVNSVFAEYFNLHILPQRCLMHYLSYLKQVYEYIAKDSILNIDDRQQYMNILKAQLTNEELFVAFSAFLACKQLQKDMNPDEYKFFAYLKTDNPLLDKIKQEQFYNTKFLYTYKYYTPDKIDFGNNNYDNEHVYTTINRIRIK